MFNFLKNKKKDYKLCQYWFVINEKITYYDGWFLNGKEITIKEKYEFEKNRLRLLYS